jgi:hypothetical protein
VDGELFGCGGLGSVWPGEERGQAVAELGNGRGEGEQTRREHAAGEVERVASLVEAAFECGWLFATEGDGGGRHEELAGGDGLGCGSVGCVTL